MPSSEQLWFLQVRSRTTGEVVHVRPTSSRKERDRWMRESGNDLGEHGYVEAWAIAGDPDRVYDTASPVWAEERS